MSRLPILYLLSAGLLCGAATLVWLGIHERESETGRLDLAGTTGDVSTRSDGVEAAAKYYRPGSLEERAEVDSAQASLSERRLQEMLEEVLRTSPFEKKRGEGEILMRDLLGVSKLKAHERVAGLEALRGPGLLTAEERRVALDVLLSGKVPADVEQSSWHWVIDELMATLRVDGADNLGLSHDFAKIALDSNRDLVLRDYALQHLGHVREEGGDQSMIDLTLRQAVMEREGTLAGSALLALNSYGDELSLGQDALEVAEDESYDLRNRITALQVAGQQGEEKALSFAVSLAGDRSQPVALRISAIATIGNLDAHGHEALLRTLSDSFDSRVSRSAQNSLSKILEY